MSGPPSRRPQPAIMLLTGPPGIGKTTICLRVADHLRRIGRTAGGIVTVTADQDRYALDLLGGDRRLLAQANGTLAGPRWKRFRFSAETLDWCNSVLVAAVGGDTDLVVLDEVGPLELTLGGGFLPGLKALLDSEKAGLVVVRPALLNRMSRLAAARAVITLEVTPENRDARPARIVAMQT